MGINTHYYTVYGVYVDDYDEKLSDVLYSGEQFDLIDIIDKELPEDFGLIMDGMGGNYMVFGKILFDSGDLRWSEIKDTFVKISIDKLGDYKRDYTRQFNEYLPDFDHYMDREWKLMTFMHLS